MTRTRSTKSTLWTPALLATVAVFPLARALPSSAALGPEPGWTPTSGGAGVAGVVEFDEAHLFFEQNATDGDLGLHFKVDGEGWDRVLLVSPHQRVMLEVNVRGNLGTEIGLTELFSESAEPPFSEVPPEDFLALFREGNYSFFGRTLDGEILEGVASLTHDLPGEAVLVSPEEDSEVSADEDLLVEWELVPDPGPGSAIEFYEVIVEKDEDDELLRVFSVHMLPTETSIRVPAEFLEAGKDYKVEILAQETSGNRTAIEVPFATE